MPETTFATMGLCAPVLRALSEHNYSSPTPIQREGIPAVLSKKDVMAASQTGTGKTAAFTLPILHLLYEAQLKPHKPVTNNHVRTLILAPTRELASQIYDNVIKYSQYMDVHVNVVFGGVKINPQMMKLRRGTDILIATPGRLLDLVQKNAVKFGQLNTLVLDEADRMLDMGFIHDIKRVIALLPQNRQTLMFSATFSDDIRQLAKRLVKQPIEITVTPPNTTVERIEQVLYPVNQSDKTKLLIHLIKAYHFHHVLVFSRTKHGANRLTTTLIKKGIPAAAIHGNKSQNVRTRALNDFKNNDIQVLVATDIAARGIDVAGLPYVINFDLPDVSEDYVHRIGRTGRAGESGLAISLVTPEQAPALAGIEHLIQLHIPRKNEPGFVCAQAIPQTNLRKKAKKPKKPKKPKPPQSSPSQAKRR